MKDLYNYAEYWKEDIERIAEIESNIPGRISIKKIE
jgi:hypothetical protein